MELTMMVGMGKKKQRFNATPPSPCLVLFVRWSPVNSYGFAMAGCRVAPHPAPGGHVPALNLGLTIRNSEPGPCCAHPRGALGPQPPACARFQHGSSTVFATRADSRVQGSLARPWPVV